MKCRTCGERKTSVLETRRTDHGIWRRRLCSGCSSVFPTVESYATRLPLGIHKESRGVQGDRIIRPKPLELPTTWIRRRK